MTEQQLLSDTDITEVGRSARVYCELAQRLEPTLADVQLAFVDVGECTHHYGTSVLQDISRAPLPNACSFRLLKRLFCVSSGYSCSTLRYESMDLLCNN